MRRFLSAFSGLASVGFLQAASHGLFRYRSGKSAAHEPLGETGNEILNIDASAGAPHTLRVGSATAA